MMSLGVRHVRIHLRMLPAQSSLTGELYIRTINS